jgi:hypothetical protein
MRARNKICGSESGEEKFEDPLENKLFYFSQESTTFDPMNSLKSTNSHSYANENKSINDWLHTCKTFQFLTEANDHNLAIHDDHFAGLTHPPFSPLKRYSEVTEGMRQVSNLKPIILCGGIHL